MASILGSFQAAQVAANRANLQRYQQGLGIYDEIIGRVRTGGGFVKGQLAQLERRKTKGVAAGMMSLSQAGLASTTLSAGLPKRWEEEVGTPMRLSIADIAEQRLTQAQMGKAGFIERRQDVGPDPGMISQLMRGVGQAQPVSTYGQYKPFPKATQMATQPRAVAQPSISRARRTGYKAPVPYYPAGSTFQQQLVTARQRLAGTDPYAGRYSR